CFSLLHTEPDVIRNLTVIEITTSSVFLTWEEPVGKSSFFKLEWTDEETATSSVLLNWTKPNGQSSRYCVEYENNNMTAENTSIEINYLIPGTQYTFRVFAVAADHVTEGRANQISLYTKPDVIRNLKVTEITTSSVFLTWEEPVGNRYFFKIQWIGDQINGYSATTNTSYSITSLTAGVNYTFCIPALTADNLGESEPFCISKYTGYTPTHISCSSLLHTEPDVIRNLIVTEITTSSLFLTWEEPAGNRDFFKLEWTDEETASRSTTNNTWYNIMGPTAGVNYSFIITAVAADKSTEGESVVTSKYRKPDVIMNLTAADITTSSVLLNWTKPNGQCSCYRVEYENNNVTAENTSIKINHLIPGAQYTFRVFAVAADHVTEGRANQISLYTKPDGIRNLGVSEITTSSVVLTWDEPTGNTYFFKLQWADDKTSGNSTTTNTSYLITGLTTGVNYTFSITAVAADESTEGETFCISHYTNVLQNLHFSGESFSPNSLNLWILEKTIKSSMNTSTSFRLRSPIQRSINQPEMVRNLRVTEITTSSLSLTWDEPAGNIDFFRIQWTEKRTHATATNTSYHINDLTAGVNYTFCITAVAADKSTEGETFCISHYTSINTDMRIEDYEEHFKQKHADGFAEEYEKLKTVGMAQSKNAALAIENKEKNRDSNVLPYDASRVKLSICGSPFDDYINASYVPGYKSREEFIAAQCPLPTTVDEFWRMIWEKNVYTIVMLNKCNKQGLVMKCEKYWPSGTNNYHNISVTTTSETELESWIIRDFGIKNVKTEETCKICQFHFTAWPDHGIPAATEVLVDFRCLVRKHMDQYSRHSPAVVHCSSGVATGVFIAIDHLIFQIEKDSMVDVYGIVTDMKMHRPLMVQTEEQYSYLQQCAYDIIRSRTGTNMDFIYQNAAAPQIYENTEYLKQ
uniref:protein-tyrosine-phosphatase n=1 Tax=Sinocyclocheilus anshuiensis TaxID=1608454 RepID=A0A671QJZ6_9TELE